MKTANNKMLTALVGAAILSLAGMQQANAAEYAGSYKGTITKQEALPIVDNGQHIIAVTAETGINKSTGKNGYFDGGAVTVQSFIDIVNGNGTHQGYWTVSKDGEQVTNSLKGKVTTVMAPDGKTPMTTIEGTVDGLYGSNVYGTIHPVGVYKVTFTSPTEYFCEWEVTGFK
jgi:hypothetical protein